MAAQEFIAHLEQLFLLSEPIRKEKITKILVKRNCPITDELVSDMLQAVSESDVFHTSVTSDAPLSTAKRRKSYYENNLSFVKPVEYLIESSQRAYMYVLILTSIQMLLKKQDICEKIKETTSQMPGQYSSHCDGSY